MKIIKKDSGTKHTLKITPMSVVPMLGSVRGKPDNKGSQNGNHWHIKLPPSWFKKNHNKIN